MREINSSELMDKILLALKLKKPLSIVSVGQTEAIVMAQDQFFSHDTLKEYKYIYEKEAYIANLGVKQGFQHRGIRLPDKKLQQETIEAVKNADIVGYNLIEPTAKKITETTFEIFSIKPQDIFEANIRRAIMFSQRDKFYEMLKKRRILLIGALAARAKDSLEKTLKEQLNFEIVDAIPMYEHEEINIVKEKIGKLNFDLCILAAGTNATILSPFIAKIYGKVAIDIGSAMNSFITGEIVTDEWITNVIGIDRLLSL